VTPPIIGSATTNYYYGSGQQAFTTDQNSQTTYYHFQEYFNRPTKTNFPDGGWLYWQYPSVTETDQYTSITNTTAGTCSTGCRHDEAVLDSLGRAATDELANDPSGADLVVTSYDSNSRPYEATNPYRSTGDPTYGYTQSAFDGLDRIKSVTDQDGSAAHFYYGSAVSSNGGIGTQLCSSTTYGLGYPTLATDEAGKKRETWTDGFGRLIEVDEPTVGSNTLTVPTCYAYDLNNNVSAVNQNSGGETRTYAYDMLSRPTQVTTPEGGTTYYCYSVVSGACTSGSSSSTLCAGDPTVPCSRTDARSITTSYTYDALSRLTSKSYNDGVTPTANFVFDACPSGGCPSSFTLTNPKGRLVQAYTSSTQSFYNYDPLGRIENQWECTPVNCGSGWFKLGYTYNLYGNRTAINYDGGFTVSQSFDTVGRINQIASSAYSTALVSSIAYSPASSLTSMSESNGLTESRFYNTRFQPCQINLNSSSTMLSSCSTSVSSGNVQDFMYGYNSSSSNNGNVVSWSGSGQQTFSRSYTYDNLNRLATMSSPSDPEGCNGLSWTYDVYGNRTNQTTTSGSCVQYSVSVNSNNQFAGSPYAYDSAGDMTNDGVNAYSYDAESRLISLNSGATTYVYDALGQRAEKITGSTQTHYWRDTYGNVRVEWNQSGAWMVDYVYMNGQLVATLGGPQFVFRDHLGTTRLYTSSTGSVLNSLDFLPFGEKAAGGTPISHLFTGLERDSESNLDHTLFRQYSSSAGRWMSPDPVGGSLDTPSSLNRYSYVVNDPCALSDVLGLAPCYIKLSINDPKKLLSSAQTTDLENAIDAVYSKSSGNQLQATFVTGNGNPDFTLTLANSDTPSDGIIGDAPVNSSGGHLYVNAALFTYEGNVTSAVQGLGTIGAHETGHGIIGVPDNTNNPPNIMGIDSNKSSGLLAQFPGMFPGTQFNSPQITAFLKKCHPGNSSTANGNGGGGGGGGTGGNPAAGSAGIQFTMMQLNALGAGSITVQQADNPPCPRGQEPDGNGGCKVM
jgi:RHS repeat-associated protein